jgi:hypothetical protein
MGSREGGGLTGPSRAAPGTLVGRWPDFFTVGAPRCGTTSLYDYLRRHPQILMSASKEPHFFGSDLTPLPHYVRDERHYLALFSGAGEARRVGEASVWYLASERAASEVQLRDPVEVMYSLHGRRVLDGQEELADFESALAADVDRAAGRRPLPSPLPLYRDAVRFAEQVARFFAVFGRAAVHVILLDDLRRDPATVGRGVLRFLGVDPDERLALRVLNVGGQPRSLALPRVLGTRSPLAALGRRLLPAPYRTAVWRRIRGLNMRGTPRPPLPPDLRWRLQEELRDEVERLGALLGRDLSEWSRR